MKKITFDSCLFMVVAVICLGGIIFGPNSLAQLTNTIMNTSTNETTNETINGTTNEVVPDFKVKIVAWDASPVTNGAVTADTTQIKFGAFVTNDTPNTYSSLTLTATNLYVENQYVSSPKDTLAGPIGFLNSNTILPYSSHFYFLGNALTLKNVSIKYGIIAHADLIVVPMIKDPNHPGAFIGEPLYTSVEDLIYTPSNKDLIPTILNNLNKMGAVENNMNSTVNQILNLVNKTNK